MQLGLVGAGTALAVVGYGLDGLSGADAASGVVSYGAAVWTADPHSTGLLEVIGSGGFALAVIGLCLLACRTLLTWVVLPLRAVGAMPLTAYTAQLVVWAIVAAAVLGDTGDLAGFRDLEPFWPMTITPGARVHGLGAADRSRPAGVGRGPHRTADGAASIG